MSIQTALGFAKQAVDADLNKQFACALVLYNKAIGELKQSLLG